MPFNKIDSQASCLLPSQLGGFLCNQVAGIVKSYHPTSFGRISFRISKRFAVRSVTRRWTPVSLPPGFTKLSTNPVSTGSLPTQKTIGIFWLSLSAPQRRQSRQLRT